MFEGLMSDISRIAIVSLLGLFVTACSPSQGAEYREGRDRPADQSSARPAATPDSDMSDMKMPEKPASSRTKATAEKAAPNQVVIENFSFAPATLTVTAGTTVTWINRDDVPHTATDTDKRFNSKALDTDEQFSFKFDRPGTYNYFCALHPKMTGQITVK